MMTEPEENQEDYVVWDERLFDSVKLAMQELKNVAKRKLDSWSYQETRRITKKSRRKKRREDSREKARKG